MFFAHVGGGYLPGGAEPHKEDGIFCTQDPPRHDIEGGEGGRGFGSDVA